MSHRAMTASEYRKLLARMDLTIIGAARVFGFSPRQTYRYSSGEGDIPPTLAKLMRLAVASRLTPEQIEQL